MKSDGDGILSTGPVVTELAGSVLSWLAEMFVDCAGVLSLAKRSLKSCTAVLLTVELA